MSWLPTNAAEGIVFVSGGGGKFRKIFKGLSGNNAQHPLCGCKKRKMTPLVLVVVGIGHHGLNDILNSFMAILLPDSIPETKCCVIKCSVFSFCNFRAI